MTNIIEFLNQNIDKSAYNYLIKGFEFTDDGLVIVFSESGMRVTIKKIQAEVVTFKKDNEDYQAVELDKFKKLLEGYLWAEYYYVEG